MERAGPRPTGARRFPRHRRVHRGRASMGCATALWAAVHDPARITALVLAIPPTALGDARRAAQRLRGRARLVEQGRLDEYVDASMSTPPPDPLLPIADLYREGYAAAMRAADPVRLARVFAARRPPTCRLPTPWRRSTSRR